MKFNVAGNALIKKCEELKITPYRDIGGLIFISSLSDIKSSK